MVRYYAPEVRPLRTRGETTAEDSFSAFWPGKQRQASILEAPNGGHVLGTTMGSKGYRGGPEGDRVSHLGEDLVAFGVKDEKERGERQVSTEDHSMSGINVLIMSKTKEGAARIMTKWYGWCAETSTKPQLARKQEVESTVNARPKGRDAGKRREGHGEIEL